MAEWADTCHQRQGLVVSPHFPYPTGEIAADIVLGKIDAVEVWPRGDFGADYAPLERFNELRYQDWYHYLNCGYRLPAVAGTDKMGAYMAVGANRVYAYLGQEEFNFENWAKAVRSGNTFGTSGPLLLLHADGHPPGAEITLGAGGGTIEVAVEAQSFVPFHRLEIVHNGKVVATREEPAGTRSLHLAEKLKIPGLAGSRRDALLNMARLPRGRSGLRPTHRPSTCEFRGRNCFPRKPQLTSCSSLMARRPMLRHLRFGPTRKRTPRYSESIPMPTPMLHRRMHQYGVPH